ncbi:serine hydrolase [Mesorhizobium comanense]|uniref:serine hydrolase n=1 Tax=Mesorhizobium comanense TaxID=2502215 RepID=UPI0014856CEB|nr:serine hydrolase [Mesorhizobium comanense]
MLAHDRNQNGVNRRKLLVAGALTLPAIITSARAQSAITSADETARMQATDVEARILRVLAGLRPPIGFAGQPHASLADRMAALHVPGVSIAVVHKGAIEWARGFGVVANGGDPIEPDTLFQAGSISKPVAAMAVLALAQAGKLDLDTDVNSYLRSWKVPTNSYTDKTKVTLRQLLSHSAGTTVHGFAGYEAGTAIPTLMEVLNGAPPANNPPIVVDLQPGTRFRYSGGGYTIVQQLLIDVTGKPFAELLDETVFRPLGMARSSYRQPLPAGDLRNAAMPHNADGDPVTGGPHVYPELAAAGLWTTPSDLARFDLALLDAWAGRPMPVLSQPATVQMLTPGLGNYGLGLIVRSSSPHRRFGHDGVNAGFINSMIASETGDGAIVMTNGDQGDVLVAEIMQSIAAEYQWPDWIRKERKLAVVDPTLLDRLVGDYRLSPTMVLHISNVGGNLFSQATGQAKFELYPQSDREFFTTAFDSVLTFETDGSADARRLTIHRDGQDYPAERIP